MFRSPDLVRLRSFVHKMLASQGACSWVRLIDTQSMSPGFFGNIFLYVEWIAPPKVAIGDVILFSLPLSDLIIVHRVCRINQIDGDNQILQIADRLIKGDKLSGQWIPAEFILGRVQAVRWGEAGSKVTPLTIGLPRIIGLWIAMLSSKYWEYYIFQSFQGQSGSIINSFFKKTLPALLVSFFHRIVLHIYALVLRVFARSSVKII